MQFRLAHNNFHVLDLERSMAFYQKALGLREERRREDANRILVFLRDEVGSNYNLQLTWMRDRKEPYDKGGREVHAAVEVDDIAAARALHREMGCICEEGAPEAAYFISDPDGYWVEVVPAGK